MKKIALEEITALDTLSEFFIGHCHMAVRKSKTKFSIITITFINAPFPNSAGSLRVHEECLEHLYAVLHQFSKRFFYGNEIPPQTRIKFKQKNGMLTMKLRIDKYTKVSTKVPCIEETMAWKVTFTYKELKCIFEELQKRNILINVGDGHH